MYANRLVCETTGFPVGFAFGYFGACLASHAWKYYKGEEKEEDDDDGYDTEDTVSSTEKFHLHGKF